MFSNSLVIQTSLRLSVLTESLKDICSLTGHTGPTVRFHLVIIGMVHAKTKTGHNKNNPVDILSHLINVSGKI